MAGITALKQPEPSSTHLRKKLTCPECNSLYTNPRRLPCFHSLCLKCLVHLPKTVLSNDKLLLTCPTCSTPAEYSTPEAFPVSLHLEALKDLYHSSNTAKQDKIESTIPDSTTADQDNTKVETNDTSQEKDEMEDCDNISLTSTESIPSINCCSCASLQDMDEVPQSTASQLLLTDLTDTKPSYMCVNHGRPMDVFCETCDIVICLLCIKDGHIGHDYDSCDEKYQKHSQLMESFLDEKISQVAACMKDLDKREREIKHQRELIKQEVHLKVKEIIETLRSSEEELIGKIEAATRCKLEVLTNQKISAQSKMKSMEVCKEVIDISLNHTTRQQVLLVKKKMTEDMAGLKQQINLDAFKPLEICDVKYTQKKRLYSFNYHLGEITYTSIALCKIKKINQAEVIRTKEGFSFPLILMLSDSSLLAAPLSTIKCVIQTRSSVTPLNAAITTSDRPGIYKVHCTPFVRGCHSINLWINNIQLERETVVIPFDPHCESISLISTIDGVSWPYGIAASATGQIIVAEYDKNRLIAFDKRNKMKKRVIFEHCNFNRPRDLLITPSNFVLVTDESKIHKISLDGKYIDCMKVPFILWGIAFSVVAGSYYVSDWDNHMIKVFKADLTPTGIAFGGHGTKEGQFRYPRCIAVDTKGMVYVSDCDNHRIQKFDLHGEFIRQIGKVGHGPGELKYPTGLVIYNDYLYVSEGGNYRVSIFTTDGDFVSYFGGCQSSEFQWVIKSDQFHSPCGVTFDDEGFLYICDTANSRILVY
jgi:tripartite motif-containing protein 2/3/tripartite motif-containing protein 71